ncbi:MAG TPA: GIY-YIG nuclease family protein [Anaeromyxobacter sp.]|nr:GIY-YIG nuclease family protein [Anaeromyxobacter sp.]
MRPFFVYMLRCRDGSYYVGHTDELEKRVAEHDAGTFPGYTCERRPVELVWFAEMVTREDALERELQLKRWTRRKKEALIAGDWDRVKALARGKDRVAQRSRPPFDYGPVNRGGVSATGPTLRANGEERNSATRMATLGANGEERKPLTWPATLGANIRKKDDREPPDA